MRQSSSYMLGFSKTAEQYGISPADLMLIYGLEKSAVENGQRIDSWMRSGIKAITPNSWQNAARNTRNFISNTRNFISRVKRVGKKIPGNTVGEKLENLLSSAESAVDMANGYSKIKNSIANFTGKLSGFWQGLNPDIKRTLFATLAAGTLPFIFSSGSFGQRALKSLGAGAVGGLGMYGLSRSGAYNAGRDYLTRVVKPGVATTPSVSAV